LSPAQPVTSRWCSAPSAVGAFNPTCFTVNNSTNPNYYFGLNGSCFALSTNVGPYAGGNTLVITNGHFGTITNVMVGGVAGVIQDAGDNWVRITMPATGSAGAKTIVVQTDGGDVTLAGAYTVNLAGQIGRADPISDYPIAAGLIHSLGLKADSTVVGWGYNASGQTDVPAPNTNFVAVAAGRDHSLGLKSNGTIMGWGDNSEGQLNVPVPNTNFVAVAAGLVHSLGLKADGTIMAWGVIRRSTECAGANTNFVAVAAGLFHSLG
jgi:hypothetical protein